MPRFTLSQLFMAVSLLAILLAFSTMQGCAKVFSRVGSLSFSHDGSKLLVVSWSEVVAQHSRRVQLNNEARYIDYFDTNSGVSTMVKKEPSWGRGSLHDSEDEAFAAFQQRRMSDSCYFFHPLEDSIIIQGRWGPTLLKIPLHDLKAIVFGPKEEWHRCCAISNSGALLATLSMKALRVWDIKNKPKLLQEVVVRASYSDGRLAFTTDDLNLVYADNNKVGSIVKVLNLTDKTELDIAPNTARLVSLAVVDHNSFLLTSDQGVQQYDLTGKLLRSLADKCSDCVCATSRKNGIGAWHTGDAIVLYDFAQQQKMHTIETVDCSFLALSPEGDLLATTAGDTVSLWDVKTGHLRWSISIADRSRTPWFLPVGGLLLWLWVAWRMFHATHKRPQEQANAT
jgi:WD40 repeat protein